MARAKNTSRAEARRRSRDAERALLTNDQLDEESVDIEQPETTPERRPMFKMPDVPADVRSLPSMFRTRRLLWIPYLMIFAGFVLAMVGPGLGAEMFNLAVAYIQLFFLPQSLLAFFFAGFLAPRASYLAGMLAGLLTGVLWVIVIYVGASTGLGLAGIENLEPFSQASASFGTSVVFGTLAGWFAGWYRDFLRQMQERGRARKIDREAQERARRRNERQETRRAAKKPTA